eukprot:4188378-Prymnesium_polylepis.1
MSLCRPRLCRAAPARPLLAQPGRPTSLPERKGRAPSGKRGRIEQPAHLPCSHSCSTAFMAPPPSRCF